MISVILLALTTTGPGFHKSFESAPIECGMVSGWMGYAPNCYCCETCQQGGIIAPGLLAGSKVETVTSAEAKDWRDYVAELDRDDAEWMNDVWAKSDFENRKRLLSMLKQLRADIAKREKEEKEKKDKKPEKKETDKKPGKDSE